VDHTVIESNVGGHSNPVPALSRRCSARYVRGVEPGAGCDVWTLGVAAVRSGR
jgi:hypothetical protein